MEDKIKEIERVAMNIVYQLDDDSKLSVEYRQANNDRRIDFVAIILGEALTSYKKKLLEGLPKRKHKGNRKYRTLLTEEEYGFNACLEQVKQLINNPK